METIKLNVNFNFDQLISAIKQLSPMEKLQINEAIWEENMDVPLAHQTLVLDRIEKAKKNPERLTDWEAANLILAQ